MNSYRIEKIRCPVTVTMVAGDALAGDVFLNPTSRFRSEPQGPAEFLNDADEYFALGDPEGGAALVAKACVEAVAVEGEQDSAGAVPNVHPVSVTLTLNSGAQVTGTVAVDAPPSRARLLDFLNSFDARFLCIAQPGRIVLVNRRAIAHVHELN